jgi:sporulation-specific protein 1
MLSDHLSKNVYLEGKQFSNELKDFIRCCLVKEPSKRPTTGDLLNHKFILNAR